MRFTIVTSSERRQRYKFLSVPLTCMGYTTDIITTTPFTGYVKGLFNVRNVTSDTNLVIIMGVGLSTIPALYMGKFYSLPVFLRLGGDVLRDIKSKASVDFKSKRYTSWVRNRANLTVSKFMINHADGIIVVNHKLARTMKTCVKTNAQIFVIPQFCEGQKIEHDYSIGRKVYLLSVSNLSFLSKALGIIDIIKQLTLFAKSSSKEYIYIIAGSGVHLSDIQHYVNDTQLPANLTIQLKGFVTDLDIYYRTADVFIYSSDHDALPNVILESKKYGLPLLANDCEEFREIVDHESSGFLFINNHEFMNYLKRIIDSQVLRINLGRRAQSEFENIYSVNAIKDRIEDTLITYYSPHHGAT